MVGEILEKVEDGQMGVVLKRMFVRAASQVAERYGVQALVTGEALGQVSSQTLTNLRLIDNVSDTLILRPLISHDKEHIIDLAREIGTADFARTMPEYCGVISKSPTVKAVKAKIEEEEQKFRLLYSGSRGCGSDQYRYSRYCDPDPAGSGGSRNG
ncbi:tRNA sulfurtransferase [Cedecea neteri]|uniref:tRNA sulfurtransferase n=1 Tax=Cedecea neteri TaxID=158822 RepID=A0A2X2T955_9ENTR|nr:tRNA sulfurtransferase [Cedecea neteri]